MPDKHAAIYVRVSSTKQDHKSQMPDLERWAAQQDGEIRWYTDKFTGTTMDRPGWNELESELFAGNISTIVVWRLDRLGRMAAELCKFVDDVRHCKVNFISLREGIDLTTAAGRFFARSLAASCQFENEIRSERVLAGQAVARAAGKTWGGAKPGHTAKITELQRQFIRESKERGKGVTAIARATGLSRQTIYTELERFASPTPLEILDEAIMEGCSIGCSDLPGQDIILRRSNANH
jgi:DNA invertase Pin-like site-specific DNA recombinase